MSIGDKWELLRRLRNMIEGMMGPWVKEASEHLDRMEANIMNDAFFRGALEEWDKKLFPQCPAQLWQDFRQGKIESPLSA